MLITLNANNFFDQIGNTLYIGTPAGRCNMQQTVFVFNVETQQGQNFFLFGLRDIAPGMFQAFFRVELDDFFMCENLTCDFHSANDGFRQAA